MASIVSRRAHWMQKIADEVARGIRDNIANGTLVPGEAVPGRDALAADYVTSLATVDRALEQLVEEHWLQQSAKGTLVAARPHASDQRFAVPEDFDTRKEDVAAVLELRMGVEVVAASAAATRRSAADLHALLEARDNYVAATNKKEGVAQADFAFHHAIALASGNSYIVDLIEYLGPLLIPRMRLAMPPNGKAGADGNLARSLSEHDDICTAIANQDPEAARKAMRAHLTRTITLIGTIS